MRNALYNQSGGTRIGPDMPCLSAGTTTTAVLSLTYKDYWRVGDKFQLRLISDDSLVEATTFTVTDKVEGSSSMTLTFSPAAAASTGTTKELARVRVGLLALSYADHELQPPAKPVHDSRLTVNSIEVSRDGGSSFLAQEETGERSIQDPPNGIGVHPDTVKLNLYSDGELAEHAYWLLNLGLNDDARWPSMELGLHSSALASRQADVLGLDIGYRVTVADMQNARIYDTQHQLTRGYTETFDGNKLHYLTVNGIPERNYHILKFDDSTLNCRWAGDSTSLGEDITDTQTGSIAVSVGGTPWTTTAGHFPQDIMIGGERVTISGNTGAVAIPTLVGVGTSSTGNNASVTPGLPSGTAVGDVVYILASIRGNTGSVNTPANWSAVPNAVQLTGPGVTVETLDWLRIFYREYDGVWSMPTVSFTGGAAGDTTLGQSCAFRNLGNGGTPYTPPYDSSPNARATYYYSTPSQDMTVDADSEARVGELALRLIVARKDDDWTSVSFSHGYAEIQSVSSTTGNDAAQTWAYRVDNGGAVPDYGSLDITVTGGASANWGSFGMIVAGGPQAFTISARSVNGVVKAHSAGAPIQIAEGFYYGL